MRRFNYPYTCPDIDKFREDLEGHLEKIIDDCYAEIYDLLDPVLTEDMLELIQEITKSVTDKYTLTITEITDKFRNINGDLRLAAENQIEELQDEVEELQDEIKELTSDKDQLESENYDLKEKIIDLKSNIAELKFELKLVER